MTLVPRAIAAVTTFLLSATVWAQVSSQSSSQSGSRSSGGPIAVPEPETLPLVALGVAGAWVVVRYFKNKK